MEYNLTFLVPACLSHDKPAMNSCYHGVFPYLSLLGNPAPWGEKDILLKSLTHQHSSCHTAGASPRRSRNGAGNHSITQSLNYHQFPKTPRIEHPAPNITTH